MVSIYYLIMNDDSDNFWTSGTQCVVKRIKAKGIGVVVYEAGSGGRGIFPFTRTETSG